MERIHRIQKHERFQGQFRLLQEAEKDRIFCRHTMEHFLDVARLMYIYSLEEGGELSKELIYGAALLHDIGRYEQIAKGTPHEISGAAIAGEILRDCGFSGEETGRIQRAIMGHRESSSEETDRLAVYLYRADKQSRNCFCCPAEKECNWSFEKKNHVIEY
ncbi:MAG: HD domain-containing protein [Clostridiales bacterium]|nr:HD domain-containing protein [Clostridiales bacterium]